MAAKRAIGYGLSVAKIALVHVPFFSHVGALTRLSGVLSRQGHEVIAWGPEQAREQIEAGGGRFTLHEPEMPLVDGFAAFVAHLAETTERRSEELIEQLFAQDVDLLIHDSQVPWARVAADYLGIPRIISHPMYPIVSPERVPAESDLAMPTPDPVEAQARLEASWLAIARRWGVELGEWHHVIHSTADTTLTYTTEELIGDYQLPPGWHCIGPLMGRPPRAPRTSDRPLVYVCFGTSFNVRPELFRAVIDALAHEPADVLISTGRGPVATADLGPLPANVVVRDFVPAGEVLARASAHITHGGCNSVHESLLAGVPMLFIPQAFDQFPLAGTVALLGAGRVAKENTEEIREGVRWLLLDELPRARADDLGEHLASYDGETRVAEIVERMLAGSSASTSRAGAA